MYKSYIIVLLEQSLVAGMMFPVLLLLKMFREGIPSAVAGFQGALHLNTKVPLKNSKNLITISR